MFVYYVYKNFMSHFAIFIQQRKNWLCSTKALLNKFWLKNGVCVFQKGSFLVHPKNPCNIDGSESRPAAWAWARIFREGVRLDPDSGLTFGEGPIKLEL